MSTLLAWVPPVFFMLFFAAVGASLGSLTNVLVYRMPRGEGVITPPSKCPACETRLTWRENIPVFGWLLLRGKCRFCFGPISARYPLVEAAVGVLFGAVFLVWYGFGDRSLGVDVGPWSPEWTANGLAATWPVFVVILVMLASLVAMTLIDAATFTIPLVLAWVPAVAAVVVLPVHAWLWSIDAGELYVANPGRWVTEDGRRWWSAAGWLWTLPTPGPRDWGWIGSSVGAVVGLGVSAVLVKVGLLGQSFADYDAWEKDVLDRQAAEKAAAGGGNGLDGDGSDENQASGAEMWVQYPHARREMVRELAFLAVPVLLAWLGWRVFEGVALRAGPTLFDEFTGTEVPGVTAPVWLLVLSGVLWGYLVGGAVVWAVRIFGSLAFGKEAMGIGDVHLLAAVGACVGWIDAVVAFFIAPFFALSWAVAGWLRGGKLRRAMPYGPFLAAGAFVAVLAKPVIESGLSRLFGSASGIDLP